MNEENLQIEKIKADKSKYWAAVVNNLIGGLVFILFLFIIAQCTIKSKEIENGIHRPPPSNTP